MPPIEFRDALFALRWRMACLVGQVPIWMRAVILAPVGTVGYFAILFHVLVAAALAYQTLRPVTPRAIPSDLPEPAREAIVMAKEIGVDLAQIEFWISQPTQIIRGALRLQNEALTTSDIAAVRASMAYAMFSARADARRGHMVSILGASFYVVHPLVTSREASTLALWIWIGVMLSVLTIL